MLLLRGVQAIPNVKPLEIYEEDAQWVSSKISGAAGPSGTDAKIFHGWLLRFGLALTSLREDMAECKDWLVNDFPPWAA